MAKTPGTPKETRDRGREAQTGRQKSDSDSDRSGGGALKPSAGLQPGGVLRAQTGVLRAPGCARWGLCDCGCLQVALGTGVYVTVPDLVCVGGRPRAAASVRLLAALRCPRLCPCLCEPWLGQGLGQPSRGSESTLFPPLLRGQRPYLPGPPACWRDTGPASYAPSALKLPRSPREAHLPSPTSVNQPFYPAEINPLTPR